MTDLILQTQYNNGALHSQYCLWTVYLILWVAHSSITEMFPLLGPHDGSFARANDWQERTRRESYECARGRGAREQTAVYWEQLETKHTAAWIHRCLSSTARYLGWGIEALKACEYDRKEDKTSRESKRNLTLFWQLSHKDHCEGMQSNALNVKDHQRFVRKNQSRMGRINMQRVKNGQKSAWVCWRASFAPLFGSVCENFLNGSGHGTCEQVVNKPGGRLDERYYFTFVCILL